MAREYTLQDVELLRDRSGSSYEEAIALLDQYDGDVIRCLSELEKRGALPPPAEKNPWRDIGDWVMKVWMLGVNTRVRISRKGRVMGDLSVLYLALGLWLAPWMIGITVLLVLALRCKVEFLRHSGAYTVSGVRKAAQSAASRLNRHSDKQTAASGEKKDDYHSITIE